MIADFGPRLARIRTDAGFTQSSLARAVGLSQSAISQIEAGERNPTYDTIRALAEALKLTPAHLVGDEPSELQAHELAHFRKYRSLTPDAQKELDDFAAFLQAKSKKKS